MKRAENGMDASSSRKILLVAGEASGDVHGAELVAALRRSDPLAGPRDP